MKLSVIIPARNAAMHLRYLLSDLTLRLTTDASVPLVRDELPFILDRELHLVLGPDETLAEGVAPFARDQLEQTLAYWREWVRQL